MSREHPSVSRAAVAPSLATDSIVRVWDIANRHFESLLATADRSATKSRAETRIQSHVKELRDIIGACNTRLQSIDAYISELQEKGGGGVPETEGSTRDTRSSELAGEWHFLYTEDSSVFGYMKLMPETVSVANRNEPGQPSTSLKRAEFTIPSGVLGEANEVSNEDSARGKDALCPCCQVHFDTSEFWKHALFEIADRGNRVPAWQSLDRAETPRWIVEHGSGWGTPIYRPRALGSTCEIGQSLTELDLKHFLSEHEFSHALDSTFEFLALQLRT